MHKSVTGRLFLAVFIAFFIPENRQLYASQQVVRPVKEDGQTLSHIIDVEDIASLREHLKRYSINAPVNTWQETLLHLAVRYRKPRVVAWLLQQRGIIVDVRCYNRGTPLHTAVMYGVFPEMQALTTMLVNAGADPHLINMVVRSPFDMNPQAINQACVAMGKRSLRAERPSALPEVSKSDGSLPQRVRRSKRNIVHCARSVPISPIVIRDRNPSPTNEVSCAGDVTPESRRTEWDGSSPYDFLLDSSPSDRDLTVGLFCDVGSGKNPMPASESPDDSPVLGGCSCAYCQIFAWLHVDG